MNKQILKQIMVWFLSVIVVGGLFYPLLGYLVVSMMLFFFILSYFRGRYWCSHLCPRGAFLDLVLRRFSLKKKLPRFFTSKKVKWTIFTLIIGLFVFQLVSSPRNPSAIGFVFVRMCLVTTIISVLLGIPLTERAWCAICPMGTLQTTIRTLNKKDKK